MQLDGTATSKRPSTGYLMGERPTLVLLVNLKPAQETASGSVRRPFLFLGRLSEQRADELHQAACARIQICPLLVPVPRFVAIGFVLLGLDARRE